MLKLLAYSLTLSLAATPALAAGPKYYHQTAAPATCTVGDLWIDTDATAGNQISTCTAANTWTKNQSLVGDCTVGPCLDGSADGGNLIKLWAGTGSYWTALQGGSPSANRSWRLPIAAAPAAGETLVMTMDEYGQMGFLDAPETSGYVLASTDGGVLSWAAGGSGGIAHATSDGTYYASKDGAWATLAGVFQPADDDLTSAAGGSAAGNSKLFGTNSSGVVGWYDIPGAGSGISHATADGKWYGSKDGAWVDLAPTFSSALPKWIDMPVGHSFTAGDLTWYNGQVWKASGTHSKVLGEYPDAESADWEDYIQAPIVVDYPTEVGVPAWTAEGWAATSYTVGTAANNLVQLNGSAQLPAVSADLLTITDTNSRFTTDTVGAALVQIGEFNAALPSLVFGTGLTLTEDTPSAGTDTISVSANTYQAYDADWLGITPNGAALVSAANYAAMKTLLDTDDIQTLTGIAAGTAHLGTFTGTTIADSSTIKSALQSLETSVETKAPSAKQIDFAVKTPVDADDFLLFKAQTAITITDIHVIAQGGTSISVDIQECDSAGANCSTVDAAITATTTGAEDDGEISNGTIDAGDWVKVMLGAPSGTVNYLAGSIYYVETAD